MLNTPVITLSTGGFTILVLIMVSKLLKMTVLVLIEMTVKKLKNETVANLTIVDNHHTITVGMMVTITNSYPNLDILPDWLSTEWLPSGPPAPVQSRRKPAT